MALQSFQQLIIDHNQLWQAGIKEVQAEEAHPHGMSYSATQYEAMAHPHGMSYSATQYEAMAHPHGMSYICRRDYSDVVFASLSSVTSQSLIV